MTTTNERVIGLWLDEIGGDEPRWIVSRDTFEAGEPADSTTVRTFDEDDYDSAETAALELADREGVAIIETGRHGEQKRLRERPHRCDKCGRMLPEATDQTDPADDEVTVDARGLVSLNEWVCGACLDQAD